MPSACSDGFTPLLSYQAVRFFMTVVQRQETDLFLCKAFCLIKGLLWLSKLWFLRRALFKIRVMGYYNSREEHLQRNVLPRLKFLWNTTKYKIDPLISVAILKTYY